MHRFICKFIGSAWIALVSATGAAGDPSPDAPVEPNTGPGRLIQVQRVEVIQSPGGRVVVLNIADKSIPIFVDPMVALSIEAALSGDGPLRPLSHDLMHSILESLDAKVTQVAITLRNGTYYAALTITAGGKPQAFDSRASDAIALAIRSRAPIMLDAAVLDSVGVDQLERKRDSI